MYRSDRVYEFSSVVHQHDFHIHHGIMPTGDFKVLDP